MQAIPAPLGKIPAQSPAFLPEIGAILLQKRRFFDKIKHGRFPAGEGVNGMSSNLSTLLVAILANVISYYICEWLDGNR